MRTVLIVDDDRIIREQLGKELRRHFFRVLAAVSGKEAMDLLAKENVDVMLLDVKLPDINGLDIIKRAKEIKPGCEVVVITGYGTQEIAIQALRMGAIDYIEKPIDADELKAALGRAMEKMAQRKELAYKSAILVADDEKNVVKKLCQILEKEGYQAFGAYSGDEALEVMSKNKIDVVIADIKMANLDGMEVLKRAKKLYCDIEVIMVTGYGDQELAVSALRAGACDYLRKPVNIEELLWSVEKSIERIKLCRNSLYRNRELKLSSEIVSKINAELETIVEDSSRKLSQTQAQLFQTAKLATLGEMSAGLAHEINQPLSGISLVAKNFRKLIERNELSGSEIESGLGDIEVSVKRMSKVIQYIRMFARQDTLEFVEVDVNATIESALSLLGEQLRLHEIAVTRELASDLPRIIGEPYQLGQVWINIITNARDALDERGAPPLEKKLRIATAYDPKSRAVKVVFADNGVGMSAEQREKIFEPFFTTKEVGKATGLGLSISYGIIESHKGRIEVESRKGKGAALTVALPAS